MDSLTALSDSISALAAQAAGRLFHVFSPLGGRTALSFDGARLLVPAREAGKGEHLEILAPGGARVGVTVKGFDPRLGLAMLELDEPRPETAWKGLPGLPRLGSLVVTAAWPSPEGPEVRLDTVRFAGGVGETAYIQTDGPSFPGFAGAGLVAPSGELAGFVVSDRPGNRAWALPAARAEALVAEIAERGFPGRAWLGISTIPVEAPTSFKEAAGADSSLALLVAGLEAGGPAETAGIMVGDLILSMGGVLPSSPEGLREILDSRTAGEALVIALLRGGKKLEVSATLGSADEGESRDWGNWGGRGHHPRGFWHRHGGQGRGGPWDCCGDR
jgi:S1-C subfamily serine protease